jgi:hypothetical protein
MPRPRPTAPLHYHPPQVRAEEGCEEEGQVLHECLVLVAAPRIGLGDVCARGHQRRQLGDEKCVQVGKVGVVLRPHLQRRNLQVEHAGSRQLMVERQCQALLPHSTTATIAAPPLPQFVLPRHSSNSSGALTSAKHCSAMFLNTCCGNSRSSTCSRHGAAA